MGSSGEGFREKLEQQRLRTSSKIQQFNQALNLNVVNDDYWGLAHKFSVLRSELNQLDTVRDAITEITKGDFFEYYSSLNAHAINIIQYLQVVSNDASLARQGGAFASLLQLQERAGQERGALNGVFAAGKLDAKHFQEISGYIADQKSILNSYYTVVSSQYQHQLRQKLNHPTVIEVEKLRAAAINKSRRDELLNDLQMMIGYGGLIHDFKDYVVRGREWYLDHYSKISNSAKNIIDQYEKLPGMSDQGIQDLKSIEITFDQYHAMMTNIETMKELGRSIIEIDRVVDIDDTNALKAIRSLRKNITSRDTSTWWEIATFRIDSIKEVSDSIKLDMISRNQQSFDTTKNSVLLYIILSIVSISITLALGFMIRRRLVDELVGISIDMRNMQERSVFYKRLDVSGDDEISDMAKAFNNLISEREKYEVRIRRSLKMDALGKLTGGIAHDYNNMLGVIKGAANILDRKLDEDSPLRSFVQLIINASERNAELTRKLLNFSGTTEVDASKMDLNKFINDEKSILDKIVTTRIQMDFKLSADIWPVWIGAGDLEDAVINLSINAMHAIDDNGQIIIKTENKHLLPAEALKLGLNEGDYVILSLTDTGCGMSESTQENIFEPFFTTKGVDGTGMGLSQVYSFVKRNNGGIEVTSEIGHGTQFTLYFPRYEKIYDDKTAQANLDDSSIVEP